MDEGWKPQGKKQQLTSSPEVEKEGERALVIKADQISLFPSPPVQYGSVLSSF